MDGTIVVSTVVVPRRLRFRFWLIRAAKWLVPDWRCLTFPVPVSRNRFFVPLWVFCLGMTCLPQVNDSQ